MNDVLKIILDSYLLLVIIYFFLSFFLSSKRIFKLFLVISFVYLITGLSRWLELKTSYLVLNEVKNFLPVLLIVLIAPELRRGFETTWSIDLLEAAAIGSQETKSHIVEAVMYLSSQKIGALITIEKHNSLDIYAEKSIILNSVVSRELLINIFTPNTPLHDGAVIIKEIIFELQGHISI